MFVRLRRIRIPMWSNAEILTASIHIHNPQRCSFPAINKTLTPGSYQYFLLKNFQYIQLSSEFFQWLAELVEPKNFRHSDFMRG